MTDSDVVFTVHSVAAVEPGLLRDLNTGGKRWVVVRSSPTREQAWSFHSTYTAARAAARRWRSREIVTP